MKKYVVTILLIAFAIVMVPNTTQAKDKRKTLVEGMSYEITIPGTKKIKKVSTTSGNISVKKTGKRTFEVKALSSGKASVKVKTKKKTYGYSIDVVEAPKSVPNDEQANCKHSYKEIRIPIKKRAVYKYFYTPPVIAGVFCRDCRKYLSEKDFITGYVADFNGEPVECGHSNYYHDYVHIIKKGNVKQTLVSAAETKHFSTGYKKCSKCGDVISK